jgi:hypothetical protein
VLRIRGILEKFWWKQYDQYGISPWTGENSMGA